ncbi:unnamed protein product, partial [Heterosigma akashiwo]
MVNVIVGGGIAGKSLAAFLRARGIPFTLLSGSSNAVLSRPDFGIGIWSPALIKFKELGILPNLEREGSYIGVSGYKAMNGQWLAQPSPLGTDPSNGPALLF